MNSGLAERAGKASSLADRKARGLDGDALLAKHMDVVKSLKAGQSIRSADKITGKGKGESTVQGVAAASRG